jgi:GAF domain-containing protein
VTDVTAVLEDPGRLAALRRLVLLDSPPSGAFDRVVRLAARVLDAPISLVTLIDRDRQFFKASVGLPEPVATARQTPMAYSICQYVVADAAPLMIDDTRLDARLAGHPAVVDLGVLAYAGAPLFSDGYAVGTLCVLDVSPRQWSERDQDNLADLASIAAREARLHLQERLEAHRREWRGVTPSRSRSL